MRAWCLLLLGLTACLPRHASAPWTVGLRICGDDPRGGLWTDPDLPPLTSDRPAKAAARETAQTARSVVEQQQSHWWQFIPLATLVRPRTSFDAEVVEADRARLEAWFHDHGWLNAAVALEVKAPRPKHRGVTFRVAAGSRTAVTASLAGFEGLPEAVRADLSAALPEPGPWSAEAASETAGRLSAVLRAAGYGAAQASVERDGTSVTYRVSPGTLVHMSGMDWVGVDSLSRKALDRIGQSVARDGEPWDGAALDRLAEDLAERPGIASVQVRPGEVVDQSAAVTFAVEQSPRLTLTPRYSLGANGALLSATVGGGFEAHGLGRRLVTTRGFVDVGYRLLPTTPELEGLFSGNQGPTGEALFEWDSPIFVAGRLGLYARASGLVDVRRGYHSLEPEGAVGFAWNTDDLQMVAAAVVDHDAYTANQAQRAVYGRWFGDDGDRFRESYTLIYPELRLKIDTLDRALDPLRGLHAEARWVPAAQFEDFTWWRADADIRGFIPLHPRVWTGVVRFWGGTTAWDSVDAPRLFGLRYHLGGPYDMRAWGFRRLGPPGYDGTLNDTPIGGNVLLYGTVESRHRVHPHLSVIPFADVGRTWEGWVDRRVAGAPYTGVDLADLSADVGLGLDVQTPLGVLRTAVAIQPLQTTDVANPPPRWTWQANLDMRL